MKDDDVAAGAEIYQSLEGQDEQDLQDGCGSVFQKSLLSRGTGSETRVTSTSQPGLKSCKFCKS